MMNFTGSFWIGLFLPVVLVFLASLMSFVFWRRPPRSARQANAAESAGQADASEPKKEPKKIYVETALTTFVAGVSVLAIAIPLGTNLFFQLFKAGAVGAAPGLVLSGLTLAVLSLITGGYLIYKLALDLERVHDGNGNGSYIVLQQGPKSGTAWIPAATSFQLLSMVTFIVVLFAGLLMHTFSPPSTVVSVLTSESSHFAVLKPIPNLGETSTHVLQDWGKPEKDEKEWIAYTTRDSYVTFCFTNDQLTKIIEVKKGVNDAVGASC
jgi:hypothetical protein